MKTPAWLLKGLFHSTPGVLELKGNTLTFTSEGGERAFSAPLSAPPDIQFPWYYFGAGLILTVEGKRYRISFIEQGEYGDVRTGIQNGKAWRARLEKLG
jgi:hypothetical protein